MKNGLKIIFLCTVVILALASTCYAKTDKILTKDSAGNYYCYDIEALNEDAINSVLGLSSPLFDDYKGKDVVAFHDTDNGFINAQAVNDAAVQAILTGTTFDLDNYTESASKDDVVTIAQWNDVSVSGGQVVDTPSGSVAATVESITPSPAPGSTIVVVTLPSGVDPTQYTITVGGTELTYNETAGKFAGTVPKSYSTIAEAQADLVVTNNTSQTDDFDVSDIY